MTYPMVLGCHDLMVHDYGPGKRYASIHVEFDKDDNLRACHEVVDQIERKCLEEYGTNLVIHLDPVITDDVHWYIHQCCFCVNYILQISFSSYRISLSLNQSSVTKIRSISISSPCHFYFVL